MPLRYGQKIYIKKKDTTEDNNTSENKETVES